MVQPHSNCCTVFHIQRYRVPYFIYVIPYCWTFRFFFGIHVYKLQKYGKFTFINFYNLNFCHHVDKAHFLTLSPIMCINVGRELWLWNQPGTHDTQQGCWQCWAEHLRESLRAGMCRPPGFSSSPRRKHSSSSFFSHWNSWLSRA